MWDWYDRKVVKYWCLKCRQPSATKQADSCGWDGSCRNCGTIAQTQVGEPAVCIGAGQISEQPK